MRKIFFGILILFSLISFYYSLKIYAAEIYYKKGEVEKAISLIEHPKYYRILGKYNISEEKESLLSPLNLKSQIRRSENKLYLCETLTQKYQSAENYLYCGNIFRELAKDEIAKKFYSLGLKKLPDLWNENSQYWDNYFVKNSITGNRFFSEKFGNLPEILEYMEIQQEK